jgi:NAD(P)-dependent dehydrogenase (short-subunit alcohol dehydrogenase family)
VIHMSRVAAAQLSPQKIRVNAICPGLIATSIFGASIGLPREVADQMAARVAEHGAKVQPVPKAGAPEDIAKAALYLASDDSEFVTGTHLVVDGGITVGGAHSWDTGAPSPFSALFPEMNGLAGD